MCFSRKIFSFFFIQSQKELINRVFNKRNAYKGKKNNEMKHLF